ncbi:MAG: glycosyltransferase family 2 protein [Candidatus Hydrogenedentota bacterium]
MDRNPVVWIVMPAYNAEKTIERTYHDLPQGHFDHVLCVDDASRDKTVEKARSLGIEVTVHPRNRGYGGNQKTCYRTALDRGADIVVMVHPDHQYDPRMIPDLLAPLKEGRADAAFGSRMLGGRFNEGGMPKWKFVANVALTAIFNITCCVYLTEIHSGFRAYTRKYLEAIRMDENSDDFIFDTEIILQGIQAGMRFVEIPIETRYFDEASQINFQRSVKYGLNILWRLLRFSMHRIGVATDRHFAPANGSI